MGKHENNPKTITINDIEYNIEDLSPEVVQCVNHVSDLNNKIERSKFNLSQLEGGKAFWSSELNKQIKIMDALTEEVEEAA